MYESPISRLSSDIELEIIRKNEENLIYAVNQTIGYSVNKEELIKALKYNRYQYDKGYQDGLKFRIEDLRDRNKKLKYYITCLKCRVSGKPCSDDCHIQYDAGNIGQVIKNLEAISEAIDNSII